jgi:hypothetical protein
MTKVVPIFYGTVEKGKLQIDRKLLDEYIQTLDGEVQVIIEKKRKKRNNSQNGRYWWMVTWIGNELGYTKEEMHSVFGQMFLLENRGKFSVVRSTKDLSTAEMAEYQNQIERLASMPEPDGLGLTLPSDEELFRAYQYEAYRYGS